MNSPAPSASAIATVPLLRLTLAVALALAMPACGRRDGPQRLMVPVQGLVTLDGQPLPSGDVYFVTPAATSAAEGYFIDVCPVKDGAFAGRTAPGQRLVQVWSFVPGDGARDPATGEAPMPRNVIPPVFSAESTLVVDIPTTGSDSLAFAIKSK